MYKEEHEEKSFSVKAFEGTGRDLAVFNASFPGDRHPADRVVP